MELHKVWRIVHDWSREEMRITRHLYLLHHLYLPLLLHHVEHCCCRHHWQLWLSHSRLFHSRLPSLVWVCHNLVWIRSRRRVSASHLCQVENIWGWTNQKYLNGFVRSLKYFLTWKDDLWWIEETDQSRLFQVNFVGENSNTKEILGRNNID